MGQKKRTELVNFVNLTRDAAGDLGSAVLADVKTKESSSVCFADGPCFLDEVLWEPGYVFWRAITQALDVMQFGVKVGDAGFAKRIE
jgi:hypothetical protein